MGVTPSSVPPSGLGAGLPVPWWRNRRVIPWVVQGAVGLTVLVVVAFLLGNLIRNLTAAGLLLSWGWLNQPAGFDIAETVLPFQASDPSWRGLLAGLVNTVRVVIAGLLGSTLLGSLHENVQASDIDSTHLE